MKLSLKKRLIYYFIALTCLIGIAYFSNQPFSEQDLKPELNQHQRIIKEVRKLPPIDFNYGNQHVNMNPIPCLGKPCGLTSFSEELVREPRDIFLYAGYKPLGGSR